MIVAQGLGDHRKSDNPCQTETHPITKETVTMLITVEIRIEADARCGATP